MAETLTGRLDHVTQQLDDLRAALESRGEPYPPYRPIHGQGPASDVPRSYEDKALPNLPWSIFAYYEPPNYPAAHLRAFTRLLAYPTAPNYS